MFVYSVEESKKGAAISFSIRHSPIVTLIPKAQDLQSGHEYSSLPMVRLLECLPPNSSISGDIGGQNRILLRCNKASLNDWWHEADARGHSCVRLELLIEVTG